MAVSQPRQRVLFYLPVVTPWWLEHIIMPLIRKFAGPFEVHVMVPQLWRGTGLGSEQLLLADEIDEVIWHVISGIDEQALRVDASGEDALIEFARSLAPDFVFARSADMVTPAQFGGYLRFIMEGGAPPFAPPSTMVTLCESIFDHGLLPPMTKEVAKTLDSTGRAMWQLLQEQLTLPSRGDFLAANGLTDDRDIIGLALEYEHEEMFFDHHHRFASNAEMIECVARKMPPGMVLAVSDHPFNALYGDTSQIEAVVERLGHRAVLLKSNPENGGTTLALTAHADGMVIGNSKSWAICAALETPWLRLSDFRTGRWTAAYHDPRAFFTDIAAGIARRPDLATARRWFAYHYGEATFDAADPRLDAAAIVARFVAEPGRMSAAA